MNRSRVLILGASGMLGSMVRSTLATDDRLELLWTSRTAGAESLRFAWGQDDVGQLVAATRPDYVVDCIGMVPQRVTDGSGADPYAVNAALPQRLAEACTEWGALAIEIATDCVFSGSPGPHREDSPAACPDDYSRSKQHGEVSSPSVAILRCSIVGTRPGDSYSLLGWLLAQPTGAVVRGFTNHLWNGITTLAYARIVHGIIASRSSAPFGRTLHVVPGDEASKDGLLRMLAAAFQRPDIVIAPCETPEPIDRRLGTLWPDVNAALWSQAGFAAVPLIEDLVAELAFERLGRFG